MAADGSLQLLSKNLADPWKGTPLNIIRHVTKTKGEFGERFTTKYLEH